MMKAMREHTVNLLNREFNQGIATQVSLTYLPYGKYNMAYLSTIKDGSTNEILSYQLSSRLKLYIATQTIETLVKHHKSLLHNDSFIHSD
ncbi:hypothetical protein KPL36_07205 [Clostridium gasigenes]|nr:hypothetical protein [Clostridium gasigenes]